ncbi:MAG: hypothetical protein A2653_03355 [Candidatus Zambryskibacteria bacterium RIFCSPHIGHO2_01_FULL_43_25]|uniref:Methyltransferase domain-containing protein n=1 Tax=Candidatus Zambryskibacteria bacterium RIFCSPLOWO2_01_FULL_45_21 TaxID=1802761 RepID=A0A1G2U1P1_9BACT|nr:MAG: hypothetical protein A2653_03355 [Candidatus Zambryskibacteria bacterium RIFCSPHIGHO2_01_FULL_43_25]OHB00173.1 MAG: hypothetical protein A3E94_01145 [Candidatus Zambryskibacteria bacterium RIFCSPHIGHO2_12_FULL_44_12b]OHB03438.1 MAG: hypothetical protein A3B14_02825 [Candidatus Zambryskibacteria bacterium RIFCSPLOWO2_01_FULL_45_21]
MSSQDSVYKKMWEDVGDDAGKGYLEIKFRPTYRIGLTNYLREQEIYQQLKPEKSDKVLDVGCASGRQVFQIAPYVHEVRGVDIAQSFINQANCHKEERGVKNTEFRVAVIESLPYPNSYFNKVICGEVLEHVFDEDIALNELLRILAPNGSLIITVPNLNADGTLWGRFLRLIKLRIFRPMTEFSHKNLRKHGDSHVREFTTRTMKEWLKSRGLLIQTIKTVSWIDGPYFDFLLKVPLHITIWRNFIIWFEERLAKTGLPFGRHMILKVSKKDYPCPNSN